VILTSEMIDQRLAEHYELYGRFPERNPDRSRMLDYQRGYEAGRTARKRESEK
jgi:hypothetical protein